MKETELTVVISGSYSKFHPEIMLTVEQFRDLGVKVLAPPYNEWVYVPITRILTPNDPIFRPLKSETRMSIRQIEDSFLACLAHAHIHYIDNHEGYIGNSVGLELGFALAHVMKAGHPFIATREPLTQNPELCSSFESISKIEALTPAQVVSRLKIV